MIGSLTTIMGPMYAGKTSELMKRILWANHQNLSVMVVKPALDNRYTTSQEIVTHTGHKFQCHYLHLTLNEDDCIMDNVVIQDAESMNTVFVDEVQFFDSDIIDIIGRWIRLGVNIVAAGLDQDSAGQPFDISGRLLAMSDDTIKLKSYCNSCGQPATKTQKMFDTGNRLDVGSHGMYEARCLEHWHPKK